MLLPSDPLSAWWLTPEQREGLHQAVHGAEGAELAREAPSFARMWGMLIETVKRPLVWVLVTAAFLWGESRPCLGPWWWLQGVRPFCNQLI